MTKHYENLDLTPIDGEVWKPIKDYNSVYEVSNLGRVKSLARTVLYNHPKFGACSLSYETKIIKQIKANTGYLLIGLCDENGKSSSFRVHRLVMTEFAPNPESKPFVNHLDGDKRNNVLSNLEWCTSSENMVHAYENGLAPKISGKDHHQSKTVYQYDFSGNLIGTYGSCGEAGRITGYNTSQINKVCMGKLRIYKDFVWSYVEKDLEYFNREFKKREGKKKEVVQYDLDGNEICRHFNTKEASLKLNCAQSNIIHAAKGKFNTAYGFKWKYADDIK